MLDSYSKQDVLQFLDFLADKGLMNKDTVSSRKAAVNTLLSILPDEEAANLKGLDLDMLLHRFANKKGNDFKPESMRVYKSRLGAVLADYERYKSDPIGYKPNHAPRVRVRLQDAEMQTKASVTPGAETGRAETDEIESIVFPIPIRKGVIVRVSGIPSDLTAEEATKVGNVILALSGSQEVD